MDSTSHAHLWELREAASSEDPTLWHLKGFTRLLLRAFCRDLNYVRDLGISEQDHQLVQETLVGIRNIMSSGSLSGESSGFMQHLNDIVGFFEGWLRYAGSKVDISHYNLKRVDHCQHRLSRLTSKNKKLPTYFQTESVAHAIGLLVRLAERSPSTFYHLGTVSDEFCCMSTVPDLQGRRPGRTVITRVVSASVSLLRLLERDINAIYRLEPPAFEEFVAERLDAMGFDVHQVGNTFTSDGGVDLIATPRASPFPFLLAVQVKHHREPSIKTGPAPIKDMEAVLSSLPFHAGMIVTNTSFTPDAEWWASKNPGKIQLHDASSVSHWIQRRFDVDRLRNIPQQIQLTPRLKVGIW